MCAALIALSLERLLPIGVDSTLLFFSSSALAAILNMTGYQRRDLAKSIFFQLFPESVVGKLGKDESWEIKSQKILMRNV